VVEVVVNFESELVEGNRDEEGQGGSAAHVAAEFEAAREGVAATDQQ
jgi:hypothetical protein